ncbi:unnamed protein product [Orchesella dallaii]|uniref:Uncharacterized protein n=1 Tax=Orchesella dallaii TaxID=48710 RepID=A0ABP1QJT6_9HEXA
MSKSGPSSARGVADDLGLHIESCPYYKYEKKRLTGLRSEDQVKERLVNDLVRRRGAPKRDKAAVQEQVSSMMSETGIIHQYLKGTMELYDSYKPLLESLCTCDEAKLVKVDKLTDVKNVKKKDVQGSSLTLGEVQLVTRSTAKETFQQDFSGHEKRDDLNLMEIEQSLTNEPVRQESADEKISEAPFILGTEQPLQPVFDHRLLSYLKEIVPDLSEDDEEEEMGTPIGVNCILDIDMKEGFQEEFQDEQKFP